MSTITRSILINAPVEKVFEYLDDPMNMMEWHPSVTNIRDVTGKGHNQKWKWDFKLFGILFQGEAQVTRNQTNTLRVVKNTGGVESTRTWNFKREAGGTRVDYELEYKIPTPVIGKVGELLAIQRSERVVDMALANIKEKMEAK